MILFLSLFLGVGSKIFANTSAKNSGSLVTPPPLNLHCDNLFQTAIYKYIIYLLASHPILSEIKYMHMLMPGIPHVFFLGIRSGPFTYIKSDFANCILL